MTTQEEPISPGYDRLDEDILSGKYTLPGPEYTFGKIFLGAVLFASIIYCCENKFHKPSAQNTLAQTREQTAVSRGLHTLMLETQ